MGRPLIDIDPKAVEGMAMFGANNCEIADFFGVNEGTIRKRFSEILTKAHATRKMKLRELQWNAANSGNTAMLIWLGKQMLDQVDKAETKSEQSIVMKGNRVDTSPKTEARTQSSSSPIVSPN